MMFKTAAVFGDLHLGKRSDSPIHNQDCLEYIKWFCDQSEKANIDLIIFVGDWFDNRSRLRLDTIAAGEQALLMLREVAPVVMIVGNHDMFFKNNRSVNSIDAYNQWDGVTVIDQCTVIDGVGFVPYLVGTEYLEVIEMDCKYMFGHFELPTFLMNSTIEMPNKGQFNADQFSRPEYVFSGHFHKRQLKMNTSNIPVWYIGSPFGHDFNDVNDRERGMMVLKWDQEPQFIDYPDGPLYQRFSTSEIMELLESDALQSIVKPTSILEIKDDMNLELEDISVVREALSDMVRETRIYEGAKLTAIDAELDTNDMDNKSLDQIVVDHLSNIDPHGSNIDPEFLISLFRGDNK